MGWLASLALYKCRAFGPHFLTGFYFEPRGGYQPDKVEPNRDRSGKLALACVVCTPRNLAEAIWAASGSETPLICIPACAGKTRAFSPRVEPSWAHPRVCGENRKNAACMSSPGGSSPRARGKLKYLHTRVSLFRLIPARAGKTSRMKPHGTPRTAHPRVCGENLRAVPLHGVSVGSSPRVRGKPDLHGRDRALARLIPACAGKTGVNLPNDQNSGAHPRVCGENDYKKLLGAPAVGSSPRVRGKLQLISGKTEARGLIPACAGKTLPVTSRVSQSRAHPRVCGENVAYS